MLSSRYLTKIAFNVIKFNSSKSFTCFHSNLITNYGAKQVRHFSVTNLRLNVSEVQANTAVGINADTTATTAETVEKILSTSSKKEIDLSNFIIPEPPTPPVQEIVDLTDKVLTASDLGIWTYWPTGAVFNSLTFLQEHMPWWAAIGVVTLVVRVAMFPLMILSQRNTAKMSEYMPLVKDIQEKCTDAQRSGNQVEYMRQMNKLSAIFAEREITPTSMLKRTFVVPLVQGFVFSSFFFTLKKMSNFPIESMKTGGLFWFTDLTIGDDSLILQFLTSSTIFIVFKLGIEYGVNRNTASSTITKVMTYGFPSLMFICAYFFDISNAILLYWLMTNTFSIGQTFVLQNHRVRKLLDLPKINLMKKEEKKPKVSLKTRIRDSYENFKNPIINSRERQHSIFEKAGMGPIKKTYKYDPTAKRD